MSFLKSTKKSSVIIFRLIVLCTLIFSISFNAEVAQSANQKDLVPLLVTTALSHTAIGPGSVTSLTITVENTNDVSVDQINFDYNLPASLYVANPSINYTDCVGAALTAAYDGSQIMLLAGTLDRAESCVVQVDLTSSALTTFNFSPLFVTSSAGASTSSTPPSLTINPAYAGFSMAYSPAEIEIGQITRLTYTIDNTMNGGSYSGLSFNDILPTGLIIADIPNINNTCNGPVTASRSWRLKDGCAKLGCPWRYFGDQLRD